MIKIKHTPYDPLMEVTLRGKITKEDMREFGTAFKQKTFETEPINVLFNAEDWEGITLRGFLEEANWSIVLKSMKKAAYVTNKPWVKAHVKLENLTPGIQSALFPTTKKAEAIEWLERA